MWSFDTTWGVEYPLCLKTSILLVADVEIHRLELCNSPGAAQVVTLRFDVVDALLIIYINVLEDVVGKMPAIVR